ncbi:MAG: nucleotidyltransferase family protein [Bryobacteraceae bacterium]|jgi:dTDP-glucose pyrophosphorylase
MGADFNALSLSPGATIEEAIGCIDRSSGLGLALVVDGDGRLINALTDGDVRRGILAGCGLTNAVESLLEIKARLPHPSPVTAPAGTDPAVLLAIMREHCVRQIPIVDADMRVIDVVILSDLAPEKERLLQALVMAGGRGVRLRPLTDDLPKPMLPVGGKPLMEHIITQLRALGIRKVKVATHYRPAAIVDYFGDGAAFGVDISYLNETAALGTGGALRLMPEPTEPVLVINGDILTGVDFEALYAYHQEHAADMTVAVSRYEIPIPYGVVECSGSRVTGIREKPSVGVFVNAGIYLLQPGVYAYIPAERRFHMTDLIETLVGEGGMVVAFPIREPWLDIGRHADYERAQLEYAVEDLRSRLVGVVT